MIRGLFLFLFLLAFPFLASPQTQQEKPKKGHLSGQWRNYYMATINSGALTDYTALASGGYLKYTYRVSKRFSLGAALYNTTHLGGMDLTRPDPITGRISRYEAGLFDGLDLSNDAVFLLGEAYLAYQLVRALPDAYETFLGERACMDCHKDAWEAYVGSGHRQAFATIRNKGQSYEPGLLRISIRCIPWPRIV